MKLILSITRILERGLLVWLLAICGLAILWPQLMGAMGSASDPFARSLPLLKPLFAVTMFAVGSLLHRKELTGVARSWPKVLGGTAIQYTCMPLLAFTCGHLFGLSDEFLWGILVVGCVPGAMASNVLTLMARGNVSYSLCLTTAATLLSPLLVPIILAAALGASVEFPAASTSWNLCWMVVLPVASGYVLGECWATWQQAAKYWAPLTANLAILWIIASVVARNRETMFATPWRLVLALIALNLLGYAAGWLGGRLLRIDVSMQRALTLEVGMQNAGLGAVLATSLFSEQAALPPALYTFGCMLSGTMLSRFWANRTPNRDD